MFSVKKYFSTPVHFVLRENVEISPGGGGGGRGRQSPTEFPSRALSMSIYSDKLARVTRKVVSSFSEVG